MVMNSLVLWSFMFGILVAGISAKPQKDSRNVKYNKRGGLGQDPLVTLKRQASCSSNQFACAYTCIPASYQCDMYNDCPGGEDEQDCPTDCSGDRQFKCSSGTCIPAAYQCDYFNDCGDASDETNCHYSCSSTQFQCANGACVSNLWVCDGINDCGDNSDENNCASRTCSSSQFKCTTSNNCIPNAYKCDNFNDCVDHSDEIGCTCDSNHFQCPKGGCINASYKCDGDNDCGDMSDEENCPEMHPGACADHMTYEDCVRMNTATYPICDYYADAHRYCRKYCGLCNTK